MARLTDTARAADAGGAGDVRGRVSSCARASAGRELVLGRRRRDRDSVTWSLPKGTPDGDETIEQTALREVEEETGLQVRILAPVGPIEYWFVQKGTRIHKTVHYYLMEPVGGDLSLHDHEFDEVRWVSVEDAQAPHELPHRAGGGRARAAPGGRVTQSRPATLAPDPAARVARGAGGAAHRLRRLVDAGPVPGHPGGARPGPRARRACSTCPTWASCGSTGPGAGDGLAYALVSDPRTLAVGRAQYSMICAPDGGIIDDLIVYRVAR